MATIRKIKSTGHYEALVYLGKDSETGKTRWRTKTFAREKEAKDWATKLEGQRNDGLVGPALSKATFADWLRDTWLPMHRTQVRSTYTIEKNLGKWICRPHPDTPFLGGKKLSKLTVADFNRLYVALAEKHGMRYRGIQHLHSLLRQALKHAMRTGELPRNPTDFATLPKPEVRAEVASDADEEDAGPVRSLTREQEARLLAAVKTHRLSALWHLLIDAGLRPGEAFALKWKHIELDTKPLAVVKVRGTLARLRGAERKARGQGWIITEPKTQRSRRAVPICDATVWQLRLWKKQQAAERLQAGPEWQDHGFAFTTEVGSPLGNNMGRAWERVLRYADGGLGDLGTWGPEPKKPRSGPTAERSFARRFSLYVLRHTSFTLALLDGVSLLEVSRRAGHTDLAFTARVYGHMQAKDTAAVAENTQRRWQSAGIA